MTSSAEERAAQGPALAFGAAEGGVQEAVEGLSHRLLHALGTMPRWAVTVTLTPTRV